MDFQELDKIKDRVAKLLRMAADASSPNEAAIAAQRARALMDKHQLDEFDVGNRVAEEFLSAPGSRYFAAIPVYLSTFAVALAKYNDCQARFEYGAMDHKMDRKSSNAKTTGKRIMFNGYKTDVELAVQMMDRIVEAVNRLCKEWMAIKGMTRYDMGIGNQFKTGAFQAIIAKLRSMTAERDALTSSNGTALVVIKKAGVDAEFGEVKYTTSNYKNAQDLDGFEARQVGYIKGNEVEIVKSVEA
jgi:hypothetical protein